MAEVLERGQWGSKIGFLLAAAGSAIGLGNIWRFTYIMGENGGAAFILVYVACIVLIGAPVFLAELVIGRHTQLNPVGAFEALAPKSAWKWVGALGVLAGALLLSFYSVVAGWVMEYTINAPFGRISGLASPEQSGAYFGALSASTGESILYHALFMIVTMFIVARGIKGGIERASKIMMPILFVLLGILVVRGLLLPGAGAGVEFMLRPDFSRLDPTVVLMAMGHAFFTLSVGMGAMITYGSYLSQDNDMPKSSLQVAFMDTMVAIAAGFAIFPALFAFGMEPAEGPGLVFVTLPVVFHQMPGGALFASMFFALFLMAALTSSISLLEVVAAYFIDDLGWSRVTAVLLLGGGIFLLGIPSALATGPWADWSIAHMLGGAEGQGVLGHVRLFNLNWFDLISHIVSDYMLPVGGLFVCLFVGWFWDRATVEAEVNEGSAGFKAMNLWVNLLRWVGPVVIGEVLVMGILAEFPEQFFPRLAGTVNTLNTWFMWLDILVALTVIVVSIAGARRQEGRAA
ncbi:MAG: sodium-dependent transporter [Acidobacteriota bacterium]|jgi:NSS family neurotransmitter:Na+ symporter